MALIRARHAVYGVCKVGEAKVRLHPDEWTPLRPLPPLPGETDEVTPETVPTGDDAPPTPITKD